VLVDGPGRGLKDLGLSHQGIIGGDQQSLSIAAASILAKMSKPRWAAAVELSVSVSVAAALEQR